MKLQFIRDNVQQYRLKELCEALKVAPSAYHASRTRKPSARALKDEVLKKEILLEILETKRYRRSPSSGTR